MVSKSKRTKDPLKETEFEFFLQININQHFAKQNCKLLTAASLRKKTLIKNTHAQLHTHTHTQRGKREREAGRKGMKERGRGRERTREDGRGRE